MFPKQNSILLSLNCPVQLCVTFKGGILKTNEPKVKDYKMVSYRWNRLDVIVKNHNLTGNLFIDSDSELPIDVLSSNKFIEELQALSKLPSKFDDISRIESQYVNDVSAIKMTGGIGIGIEIREKNQSGKKCLLS